MSVGKRIRALRARRGIMNQEELAYLVGTARQTVSSWERDVFMPDSANLLKLADALRTSVAYLMGEVLDPDAPEKRKDCAGDGEGLCVVYSLTARVRDDSVMLSVERRECGKTVRYDMSPDDARKVFPHVELLWQRIKRESEGHT